MHELIPHAHRVFFLTVKWLLYMSIDTFDLHLLRHTSVLSTSKGAKDV